MAPGNTRLPLNMGGGAVGIESVLLSLLLVSSLVAFSETSVWRLLACASCCIADWRDADRVDREGEVYRATVENAVQSGAPLSAKARAVADILMILSQEKMEDKGKVNLERMEDGIWFRIQLYRETGVGMHEMKQRNISTKEKEAWPCCPLWGKNETSDVIHWLSVIPCVEKI